MTVHINLLNDNTLNSVLDNYFTIEASDDNSKRFKKIPIERIKQSTMYYKYEMKNYSILTSNTNQ